MKRDFIKNNRGNMSVAFCLALLPLMLAAGLAVDYSTGSTARSELQAAADAAALAGVALRTYDGDSKAEEARRVFSSHLQMMSLAGASSTPEIAAKPEQVTISVASEVDTTFLKIAGVDSVKISATATAVPVNRTPICMLALAPTGPEGIGLSGNPVLRAKDCAVQVNSSSQAALRSTGAAAAKAKSFCVTGGYQGNRFDPLPETGCPVVPDPYAGLPVPPDGACDFIDRSFAGGAHRVSPGIYCGGLDIGSGASMTLDPGVYIMRDGPLTLRSHSKVRGEGVTFYFQGDNAVLEIRSQSKVDLVAPFEGPYAGVAFAQHAGSSAGLTSRLVGGATLGIIGALYFPTQTLEIGGGSGAGARSPYMPMVANRFELRGNGIISVTADHEAAGFEDVLAKIYVGARLTH